MPSGARHHARGTTRGRAARVAGYLWARFGPLDLAATTLFSLSAQAGGATLARSGPLLISARAAAGAAAGVLLALYLRISDDLKDWETDRRLAEAGDARFTRRPQVTGDVSEQDLRGIRVVVTALVGMLLALQPAGAALLGGGAFFGAWLSARWFFHPGMARSLPLAFATHNPLALLFLGFAVAVGAAGASPPPLPAATLLLGLYLPVAAWEIARKVRTPEEETGYETWSRVLGWRTAAAIPALLTAVSAALLAFAGRRAGLGPRYPLLLFAGALGPIVGALSLLVRPSPAAARRLRPAVEGYSLVAGLGFLVGALVRR